MLKCRTAEADKSVGCDIFGINRRDRIWLAVPSDVGTWTNRQV